MQHVQHAQKILQIAFSCAYAWHTYDGPPQGTVLLDGFGGLVLRGGVYVRIWAQDPEVVLEVARALKPIAR